VQLALLTALALIIFVVVICTKLAQG